MTSATVARLRGWLALLAIALAVPLAVTAQQPQQGVFRSRVDLIAVDAQVIDGDGNPIGQIDSDAFQVSIQGKRRKVVSAQFIQHTEHPPVAARVASLAPTTGAAASTGPGRTIILAVDAGSFEAGATQAAMAAARNFIQHLAPDDEVGLYVFPTLTWIEPSTGRAAISARLNNVVGEKEPIRSYFSLSLHDIVDISAESQSPFAFFIQQRGSTSSRRALESPEVTTGAEFSPVLKIASRECPSDEPGCPARIYSEGMGLAAQLQHTVQESLSGIGTLLRVLGRMPGRKAVVLVTGGLLVSDLPTGRPDVGNVARAMGQAVAQVNATLYTVHVDQTSHNLGSAVKKRVDSIDLARDRAMNSNWLEDFSRSAGGMRINVAPGGAADFAFDRVLRETSAYYLLGVEPADADRDGRPHELKVKVDRRGVTVRNRQWVHVPPKGSK
jgi:VWFA-related protein